MPATRHWCQVRLDHIDTLPFDIQRHHLLVRLYYSVPYSLRVAAVCWIFTRCFTRKDKSHQTFFQQLDFRGSAGLKFCSITSRDNR